MKPFLRWTFGLTLALVFFGLLAGAGLVFALGDLATSPDLVVTVDGETVAMGGLSVGTLLLAAGGVALAVLIVLVVVPLALLFGLGVPLLLCAGGLVIAVLACGTALLLVASPFILLAVLVVWMVRPRRARRDLPSPT